MTLQGRVNPSFEDEDVKKQNGQPMAPQQQQQSSLQQEGTTEEREQPQRQQWSNKREFLLSCISMCVGVGNVWRFAFVALENGGGAFLIPYLIVLVFIGKPLYYMEFILGQFPSAGPVDMWAICPAFKGIGYGQALSTWAVSTFYVSLMALCLFYFFASFSSVLPWAVCGPWASSGCVPVHTNTTLPDGQETISSAEEYLVKEVLKVDPEGFQNGIGLPDWRLTLCLLLSWVLIFMAQMKGVKSSGKSAYFTALFPYAVLLTLFIRGVTLPGSLKGILFFLTPRWEKLLTPQVWFAAVNQAFFSLGIGFGIINTFASYNNFHNNIYLDATIMSYTDAFTSVFAGITTFGIVGHLADQMGVEVSQVVRGGGINLAFISYPDALARFTFLPQFFSVMFFLMMFTLGVGSAVAYNTAIITIISDRFPRLPVWHITLGTCVVGFLVGLIYTTPQGQYVLVLVDYYSGGVSILFLMTLETVAVMWVYGLRQFIRDIHFMLDRSTGFFWRLCWGIINPIFLAVVFVYGQIQHQGLAYGTYVYDSMATGVASILTVTAGCLVPLMFLKEVIKRYDASKGLRDALIDVFSATSEWSPKDPALRQEYLNLQATENKATPRRLSDKCP
ncbi:sodium-dependent nutrient amino acid transporter 1-like isoform X1 [Portunus trituberculatus]|uniref:sodium-dependent nutrient amino acid transporter 1-like isoform X1 n=1 Tax=Portunus trituberculatus TaxID=210409 RepID=UPI001E1CC350|nr:sodium-dependent nutrient amino acid transporter 1-like isoform X1 [Portunus trituberculatus]